MGLWRLLGGKGGPPAWRNPQAPRPTPFPHPFPHPPPPPDLPPKSSRLTPTKTPTQTQTTKPQTLNLFSCGVGSLSRRLLNFGFRVLGFRAYMTTIENEWQICSCDISSRPLHAAVVRSHVPNGQGFTRMWGFTIPRHPSGPH